ncbi:MAG: ribonuclease HI family protein [Thermoplasmata archaeon]|nr:ribonuclease HI family protein [Thermoplasmata archaeon]
MSPQPIDAQLPRGRTVVGPVVTVHFDGACQPPRAGGVATYGFTVEGESLDHEEMGLAVPPWSPSASNNVAEYVAAIRSLEYLRSKRFQGTVVLLGDSQLVVRQMEGEYEVRSDRLQPYYAHLRRLVAEFVEVRFEWIPRESNVRADALSKEALAREGPSAGRLRPRAGHEVIGNDERPAGPAVRR